MMLYATWDEEWVHLYRDKYLCRYDGWIGRNKIKIGQKTATILTWKGKRRFQLTWVKEV